MSVRVGLRTMSNFHVVTVDINEDGGAIYKLAEDQPSTNKSERESTRP